MINVTRGDINESLCTCTPISDVYMCPDVGRCCEIKHSLEVFCNQPEQFGILYNLTSVRNMISCLIRPVFVLLLI